jgi:hypothetical protein
MIPLDPRGEGGAEKVFEVTPTDSSPDRTRQPYFDKEIHSDLGRGRKDSGQSSVASGRLPTSFSFGENVVSKVPVEGVMSLPFQ